MQFYKQTTKYTCAASSLMMIVNHFKNDFPLSKERELIVWQNTVALPTRGSNFFALAIFAHKEGIPTKIVVEQPEYKFPAYRFKGYKKKEVELAAFVSSMFRDRAKRMSVVIEERDFDLKEVRDLLARENKIILMRLAVGILRKSKLNKNITHYLPVFAFEKGKFHVMDPQRGLIQASEEELKESFEAVKTKCKKDHRMIIFG